MRDRGNGRPPGPDELLPTAPTHGSRRFVQNAGFRWADGHLVAIDVDGREHAIPAARSVVLQTDLRVSPMAAYGAHDALLVLDDEGRVLVRAPKDPFDPKEVESFCLAHGLPLAYTERTPEEPPMPPKAAGFRSLAATRRLSITLGSVLVTSVVVGLVTPLPLLVTVLVGALLPDLAAIAAGLGSVLESVCDRGPAEVEVVHLPAGRRLVCRDVQYHLPTPDQARILVFQFSTPTLPIEAAFCDLFSAIVESLEWDATVAPRPQAAS